MGFKSVHFCADALGGAGDRRDLRQPRIRRSTSPTRRSALLKTFADQAVIAIQNAKLFHEIQEKSHQLEIANQHKSAFLANMSHELRTPLNAVIGFSEMLAARYFGDLTDEAGRVRGRHPRLGQAPALADQRHPRPLEDRGRPDGARRAREFDLRAALDNALTLVRERAQRGGVALRLETDPALGAFRGDERKVKQVVLNLLSNAVKFTPRGGAVGVVAKQANGSAEIAVTDTGVGIAPADQEAIFEAFRQVGTDVTRKREGTGLGLALDAPLRRAARRYDPRRERSPARARRSRLRYRSAMANELVLIVEDNAQNLKLARDLLQVHGYRTIEAETGEDGVALALERAPALVVMDIHLPGMSGIEALIKLRSAPATRAIPVIAFTASVMPQDRNDIIAAGFDAFVSKPINIEAFLGAVAAALAKRGAT